MEPNTIIIDASNCIVGRIASFVAKNALLGKEIVIVNSKEAIISGNKRYTIEKFHGLRRMGTPTTGPYYPRVPKLILRRIIRGMLPFHQHKGRIAYKRINCFNGFPEEFAGRDLISIRKASSEKLPTTRFITLKELARELGWKEQ